MKLSAFAYNGRSGPRKDVRKMKANFITGVSDVYHVRYRTCLYETFRLEINRGNARRCVDRHFGWPMPDLVRNAKGVRHHLLYTGVEAGFGLSPKILEAVGGAIGNPLFPGWGSDIYKGAAFNRSSLELSDLEGPARIYELGFSIGPGLSATVVTFGYVSSIASTVLSMAPGINLLSQFGLAEGIGFFGGAGGGTPGAGGSAGVGWVSVLD